MWTISLKEVTSNIEKQCRRCDKKIRIKDASEGALILGRRVLQDSDVSLCHTMDESAADRLSGIDVPREYLASAKTIDELMLKRLQEVLAGLNWLSNTGRPDLAGAASTIPGSYQHK